MYAKQSGWPIVYAWKLHFLNNKATNFNMFYVQELMKIEVKNSILWWLQFFTSLCIHTVGHAILQPFTPKKWGLFPHRLIWGLPHDLLWSTEWSKSGGVLSACISESPVSPSCSYTSTISSGLRNACGTELS